MKQSRILEGVEQARFVPPYLLSLLLAAVFILGGQKLAVLALEPISALLSLLLGWLGQGGFFEIFFNFALPFLLFGFIFMALALFAWVRFAEGRPIGSLGFVKKGWLLNLLKGFGLGFVLFSLVALLMLLTGVGHFEWGYLTLEPLIYILILIPLWIIQGGTEELVTRAWLLPVAVKKTNLPIGLVTSSLLFAFLHLGNPGIGFLPILNIALFGFLASLYLLWTDNVWGIVGLHAAWNFTQGNIYGFSVSGTGIDAAAFNFIPQSELSFLTGGSFGAEASLYCSLVTLLAIAFLLWRMKKDGSLARLLSSPQKQH
ncbi:CPBP family intramembrane glutamic endopeptidase [Streptococcus panodentis]|uniref:CPBP family intramembrane metalloprotease domain-containing protein n=1 Tax=Streptococcus panodentis TaxID=1581472 RepID=A0ABS5AZ78_9STRE|nr:type II CAAX endopeptidase family protein [Streptococcus panodentis]MBP2621566.1 CPBP family intramembrane metalloprotease domain-containing protein [Streptococcus panodentis]